MTRPLLVGVDVHRATNTVAFLDSEGQEVAPRFTVPNNHPGTETFIHKVAQSATDVAEETRLTRTGNPHLRYYFC